MDKTPRLWISLPNSIHHNFGLQIFGVDEFVLNEFWQLCWSLFPTHAFGTFRQGWEPRDGWGYFEFWSGLNMQDKILNNALVISEKLNLPLDINNY